MRLRKTEDESLSQAHAHVGKAIVMRMGTDSSGSERWKKRGLGPEGINKSSTRLVMPEFNPFIIGILPPFLNESNS